MRDMSNLLVFMTIQNLQMSRFSSTSVLVWSHEYRDSIE